MFRFFVNNKEEDHFIINKDTLKHMKAARVLEEEFIILNNGKFYKCFLENESVAKIIEEIDINNEFENEVVLCASIINIKRFEWLIQKATELGATKLIPMITTNISNKISGDIDKKVERWNQIAISAAEQSFRNKSMIVTKPMNFEEVISLDIPNKFIAHEKSDEETIDLYPQDSIFLIGPEGGFTDDEISLAKTKNFKVISLGKRILRSETSGIYILSRIK